MNDSPPPTFIPSPTIQRVVCGPVITQCEYTEHGDRQVISRVRIPLTPEQWVDVVNIDGESLPSCCGTISAAREMFVSALREGQWLTADTFRDLCETLAEHDGFEYFADKARFGAVCKQQTIDAISAVAHVWHHLNEQLSPRFVPHTLMVPTTLTAQADLVARAARTMSFAVPQTRKPLLNSLFDDDHSGMRGCQLAEMYQAAAEFMATLPPLLTTLSNTLPKVFACYAITLRDTGSFPNPPAPLVFRTRYDVEKGVGLELAALDRVGEPARAKYMLRLCSVSIDGTEFGPEVPWWSDADQVAKEERDRRGKSAFADEVRLKVRVLDQAWDGVSRSWVGEEGEVEEVKGERVVVRFVGYDDVPAVAFDAAELGVVAS